MKKTSQRATRVGDQIQKELADLLRNEVKDPRVGPVTVTHVDVTSDLSHATVHFTHLAGREQGRRDAGGAGAHLGLPAQRAVAPARPLLGAATAFRLRRFDRIGMRHLAADRRRDRGRQEARIGIDDRASAAHPAHRAGASTACCCSTSRRACRRTRRCSARSARSTPKRPATPARSIRSPRGCCRCASARRPSSRNSCSTRPSATRPRCASASRRRPATPKATSSRRVRSRWRASDIEAVLPAFTGRIAQVPPAYSALKFEGRSHYEYARAGIEVPRAPREIEIIAPRAARLACAGRRARRRAAARAPTSACWPRTSGGAWAAARIWRPCGGPPPAASASATAITLEQLEAMDDAARDARAAARRRAAARPAAAATRRRRRRPLPAGRAPCPRPGSATAPAPCSRATTCWASPTWRQAWRSRAGWSLPRPVAKRWTWLKSKRFSGYNLRSLPSKQRKQLRVN